MGRPLSRYDAVRMRVAVHEAGHTMASLALGIPVESVAISLAGGPQSHGRTVSDVAVWEDCSPLAHLLVAVSGEVAEVMSSGATRGGAHDDRAMAERAALDLVDGLDPAPVLARARAVARVGLLEPRWRLVNQVAVALLRSRNGQLSGEELDEVVLVRPFDVELVRDEVLGLIPAESRGG